MLLYKKKQALLFKLRNPERITTVIPTAKLVKAKGQTLVAVPHRPDETKVLRNLGFNPPDPMPLYYQWPDGRTPYEKQVVSANFMAMHPRNFCLNGMGSGKSFTALAAYDYKRSVKRTKKLLIVCPLSTMERAWGDEIFRWYPHLEFAVLHGTRQKRLKLLADKSFDVYIVNHHGLKIIAPELKGRDDIDHIIVDEGAEFSNSGTDLWKALNVVCNKQTPRDVWWLTATPIPHSPEDAWAQCRVVIPTSEKVPIYFGRFRDMVMKQVSQYKWVPKQNAVDVVYEMMQPAVRFPLDAFTDLPEQVLETREVELSEEQKKAYKDMLTKLHSEHESGQITAVNEAVKVSKLIQICAGVAYGNDGQQVVLDTTPRLNELKSIIRESDSKVIVFVPLTGALEHVANELRKHWTVSVVHGETPKTERDTIFKEFQSTPDPHVLVANAGTMAHGLTLTAASTIVWYAPISSNRIYSQANGRVRRPGQKKTCVVVHIAGSDAERKIYQRLASQEKMQGVLLEMIEEAPS